MSGKEHGTFACEELEKAVIETNPEEVQRKFSELKPEARAYLMIKYVLAVVDARCANGDESRYELHSKFVKWLRSPDDREAKDMAIARIRREEQQTNLARA